MRLQENTAFDNRYQLVRLLGRGGFSEVWLAKDSYTKLDIALKVYAPGQGMTSNGLVEFSAELAGVFNLNHTNLLKSTHVDTWEGMPYLIMPFCSQGSITKLVGKMQEYEIWKLIHDVASGLAYLHKNDIVHQDIKPDNILIDDKGHYVITDFGISTKARSTLRKSAIVSTVFGGTMAYMGPERFGKQPAPTKASDIWSFGAMIYELITSNVPFGDLGGGMQKGGADIPEITEPVSDKLKQIVYQMLSPDTWDRPTAEQLRSWISFSTSTKQISTNQKTCSTVKWATQSGEPHPTQQLTQKQLGFVAQMKKNWMRRNLFVNIMLCVILAVSVLFTIILCLIIAEDIKRNSHISYLSSDSFWPVIFLQGTIVCLGVWRILKWEKCGISIMLLLCLVSVFPWIFGNHGFGVFFDMLCAQYFGILLIWLILLIPKNGISTWKQCKDFSIAGKIINGFCIAIFVITILFPLVVAKTNGFNRYLLGYGVKCINSYTHDNSDLWEGGNDMVEVTYAIAFGHYVNEKNRKKADKWFGKLMHNEGLNSKKFKIGCDYLMYLLAVMDDELTAMSLYDKLKAQWGEQAITDYIKSGNNDIPNTWNSSYIYTNAVWGLLYSEENISEDIYQCRIISRDLLCGKILH